VTKNIMPNYQIKMRILTIFGVLSFCACLSVSTWGQQALDPQNGPWTPNYKDADILEVIKFIQDATGKTIVVDPRVQGQITVMSSTPVDQNGLYSLFLAVLDIHGFTANEVNGIVRVINNREIRSAPVPFGGVGDQADKYITEVIPLNNIAAQQILPILRPLVNQGAHLTADPGSNVLIQVDTAANVARMKQLVERVDQAAVPETELVRLKHAEAEEMVRILTQVLRNQAPAGQATAGTQLVIVPDKRSNSVLVTGEARQRARVKALIENLDQPQPQSGNVQVIYLEYADAQQVAEVLTTVVQNKAKLNPEDPNPGASNASIVAETDTNAIIITADIDTLNSLKDVIARLDIQRAQVLVEAIIVEISAENARDLGIQWVYRNDDGGFASSIDGSIPARNLGGIAESSFEDDDEDALTGLAGALASITGQTIGVGRLSDSSDFIALIRMLQSVSDTNILSTPNLLTTDNHTATIVVGSSVPFRTGTYTGTSGDGGGSFQNPFQTIDRENVGTTLEVTPHINEGGKVTLEINQEVSSIAPPVLGAADLVTNERKIETQVTVRNGETVVLGGLIRDNIVQSNTKVPFLGDIPWLGHLFRSQSTSVQKTNLLVFIRPTIIRDDETLRGATAEKYKSIRDMQKTQMERNALTTSDKDLPLLPDWEDVLKKMEEIQRNEAEAAERRNQSNTDQSDANQPDINQPDTNQPNLIRPPQEPQP